MPETSPTGGFLGGITDFFGSVLQKAPDVINAINAPKTQSAANQRDAYGRLPGESGYGTALAPSGIKAAGLPTWVKPVAYVVGGLLAVALLWKLLKK